VAVLICNTRAVSRTLLPFRRYCQLIRTEAVIKASEMIYPWLFSLGSQGETRDLSPALESFLPLLPIDWRGKPMAARTEMLGDRTIGGEKALGLAWGVEPLRGSLALARGRVGVFGALSEIPVLAMFDPGEELGLALTQSGFFPLCRKAMRWRSDAATHFPSSW
jgi:hypothetical protein